jgi:hypothetical protein
MVYRKIERTNTRREKRNQRIRELYATGEYSMARLGKHFRSKRTHKGLTKQQISLIVNGGTRRSRSYLSSELAEGDSLASNVSLPSPQ